MKKHTTLAVLALSALCTNFAAAEDANISGPATTSSVGVVYRTYENAMHADDVLEVDESIYLRNDPVFLVMQGDCNLVLYLHQSPQWASHTAGQGSNCHATMNSDGRLCVYTEDGREVWSSENEIGRAEPGYYVAIGYSSQAWSENAFVGMYNEHGEVALFN